MFILFLIVFISLVGFGIILPLFPFYAERFGASPEVITWTMAAFTLAQAVGTPIWGRISDAYGRRMVLILTMFGSALAYVMLAYAEGPEVFELPLDRMESAAPRRLVAAGTDVGRILYHPDGRRIATFERIDESSGVIRLWSRSSGSDRPLRSFQAPIPDMRDLPAVRMRKIRFDPGGKWMAAINMNDLNILLWDLSAPPGTQPMSLRTGETSGVTMAP